ncbi:MAG: PmoA family protein [Chitinophagaceae bacterium]
MKRVKTCLVTFAVIQILSTMGLYGQEAVTFVQKAGEHKVDVMIGGKFFTSYLYPNTIEKPVLFPLQTASGVLVSRGFPLNPRPNERTDHPHHIGIWFNYGDVNGLDFWNNSYAIPESAKSKYGSIKHQKVVKVEDGKNSGKLTVTANWVDIKGKVLMKEQTTFIFSGDAHHRVIDRIATLTAQQEKVNMKDNKEGLLGIRVTRELEIPADKPEIFTDAQGNPTKVAVLNNEGVTGNFLTSNGKTGNDVWGTRGKWCLMYGKKNNEPVSIAIIDHPGNAGYPTYWHARGYGLFAANNLGQEALSGGKEKLNFSVEPGKSVTFRYRVVITNGSTPTSAELDKMAVDFSK